MWHDIGNSIGEEAAQNIYHRHTFWAPSVNLVRDPRWGRGQEIPGEDPYATSEYAYSWVSSFQGGTESDYIRASSCCKVFAVYTEETNRYAFNAVVNNPQDFTDTYFPAFQSCAQRAKASGVMCSYNAVNGIPSCANKWLLKENLREKWGFQGYVTSDCGAVGGIEYNFHYTNTTEDTIYAAWSAGMDIDCGHYMTQETLEGVVGKGKVTEQMMDQALSNLFTVQM